MASLCFENSMFNKGSQVLKFVKEYFNDQSRPCFLVAAAGFDPRSTRITEILADGIKDRLEAVLIREIRPGHSNLLLERESNKHKSLLESILKSPEILEVDIFDNDYNPIGGRQIIKKIQQHDIEQYPDIILDFSALSIGIWYPLARYFIEKTQKNANQRLHFMVYSDPELDDKIFSEPSESITSVRGFQGELVSQSKGLDSIRFWLPMLTKGNKETLNLFYGKSEEFYKICPILPFPSQDPRSADNLLLDNITQLKDEWKIDHSDIVYASENNPLNCYRILVNIAKHYEKTVEGVFQPSIILTPMGSKIMTLGAMLAAFECNLKVRTIETLSYDFDPKIYENYENTEDEKLIHLMLV